jgi:MFS superfamily sulfate permease-like transporter
VLAGLATLGVILAGPLNAVLISVALAILRFISITARPVSEVLGRVPGLAGFHARARNPEAEIYPGITFFRFNAPLVFFNAPAFTRAALDAVAEAGPGLEWFVLDFYPITQVDSTGFEALRSLRDRLAARGVTLVLAGRQTEALAWLEARGLARLAPTIFPTMNAARRAFRARRQGGAAS